MASDEEDSDSAEDLPALGLLLAQPPQVLSPGASAKRHKHIFLGTPRRSPRKRGSARSPPDFSSPLSHRARHDRHFDQLAAEARTHDDFESTALKRLKTALAEGEDKKRANVKDHAAQFAPRVLEDAVGDSAVADTSRVLGILKRTEAMIEQDRWFFFDSPPRACTSPFPTTVVPERLQALLVDDQARHESFISGLVETSVLIGRTLPGELLLWLWEAACLEPDDDLRLSYFQVLQASKAQMHDLITPAVMQRLFINLGARETAVETHAVIDPITIPRIDANISRSPLKCTLNLLGSLGQYLQQAASLSAITMLLRLAVDRVILESLDIVQSYQNALKSLCESMEEACWQKEVCTFDLCGRIY